MYFVLGKLLNDSHSGSPLSETSLRVVGLPETHWESGGERYSNGQPSTRCVCLAGLTFEVMVPVVSDHNFKPGCNRVVVGGFRLLMVAGVVIASTTPPGY